MTRRRSIAKIGLYLAMALALVVLLLRPVLGELIVWDYWDREQPLVSPLSVKEVRDGTVVLADGRTFRPAGVVRKDGVTPDDYDKALSTLVSQGIVVTRDLGDGRAFAVAEPKFYNWCRSCGNHRPFRHWAGTYYQCPASEAMVFLGYASFDTSQPGLTAREKWRLEGVTKVQPEREPVRISPSKAFRFEGNERFLSDLDLVIEALWQPPS